MNNQRIFFATSKFIEEMAKWAEITGRSSPPRSIEEYPEEQIAALFSAVEQAIQAADPSTDYVFFNWLAERGRMRQDRAEENAERRCA